MFSKKQADKDFKDDFDVRGSRRRRETGLIQLRKQTRDARVNKQRRTAGGPAGDALPGGAAAASGGPMGMDGGLAASRVRQIPELVAGINSPDAAHQYRCTVQFRKMLSVEHNPPISQVIAAGVVPRLVSFLHRDDHVQLQFEAAWTLTNIASGESEHTSAVMAAGAVPLFVKLLKSANMDVKEQCVWALGNIAGDSSEARDLVLRSNILDPLMEMCQPTSKLTVLRNATWTLSNLCRGRPQPDFALVQPSLPVLAHLLFITDEDVLMDACWALSYLSDDNEPNNDKIQTVIASGCVRRIVDVLLSNKSSVVKTPALRTIGNMVTGDDLQTQIVINCGALSALRVLLDSDKRGIRKEACWTISNITAGSPQQIAEVFRADLVTPLVHLLETASFDIQKEAAWAISNATTGGTPEQVSFLVSKGIIPPMCELFTCSDNKIVMVALEGVENILRVGAQKQRDESLPSNPYAEAVETCDGIDKLENLQLHRNPEIYNKALEMISTFYGSDDTGDASLAPQATQSSFVFSGAGGFGDGSGAINF